MPAHDTGVPSTAAVAGHPIHPMLIPLPIAFLSGALATDLAYARTRDRFWARASHALTGAGIASGLLAAPFGFIDFAARREVREHPEAWIHGLGNAAALGLAAISFRLRSEDPEGSVVPAGLALSAGVAALLTVTGWLGGELSYRHGIGMVTGADGKSE